MNHVEENISKTKNIPQIKDCRVSFLQTILFNAQNGQVYLHANLPLDRVCIYQPNYLVTN